MTTKLYVPATLPEWFSNIASNGLISAKDIVVLFGYATTSAISNAVSKNMFPAPDKDKAGARQAFQVVHSRTQVHQYWSKKVILAEIRRRHKFNQGAGSAKIQTTQGTTSLVCETPTVRVDDNEGCVGSI